MPPYEQATSSFITKKQTPSTSQVPNTKSCKPQRQQLPNHRNPSNPHENTPTPKIGRSLTMRNWIS